LNRRLSAERRSESSPLQGIRNTLGSLKDELFADDDWDDDPWAAPSGRATSDRYSRPRQGTDPWDDDFYR